MTALGLASCRIRNAILDKRAWPVRAAAATSPKYYT